MRPPLPVWLTIALALAAGQAVGAEAGGAAFGRALAAAEWRSALWSEAREAVELYECVAVRSLRTETVPGGMFVSVDAIGTRADGVRRPLPERWHLTVRDGRVDRAVTEGMWLTGQLRLDGGEHDRALLEAAGARTLAEVARGVGARRGECRRSAASCAPLLAQIAGVAKRRGDAIAGAYALAALAQAEGRVERIEEARRLAAASGDRDALVSVDVGEARLVADPDRREELYARAAQAVDLLDDPRPALVALREHADLALARYRIKDAFRLNGELEATSRRIGWSRGAMYGLYGQARVKANVRDFEGARAQAAPVVTLARELGDAEMEARALNLAGQTLTFVGDVVAAIPILLEALAVVPWESPELGAVIHTNLAKCYNRLQEWKLVDLHVRRALEVAEAEEWKDAPPLALMTYEFASAHARDCRQAIAYSRRGLHAQQRGELWLVWSLKARLGQGLIACGEGEAGIRELYEAIDLVEVRRALTPTSEFERAGYFAGFVWVYQALVAALVDLGRCEEALAVAEQMRARALTDRLAAGTPGVPLAPAEEARQRALNERIVALNRARLLDPADDERTSAELVAVRRELQLFAAELALRQPQFHHAAPWDAAVTPGELRADSAAVEFVVTGGTIIAFVVRSSGVSAVRLPGAGAETLDLASRFSAKIAARDPVYADDAAALYVRLFEPLRAALAGVRNLTVVADGALWLIPFEALRPSAGTFLADQYEIEYRLSLTSRPRPLRNPSAPDEATLLVLTSPSSASLPDLPDATREAREIAALYGSSRADIYEGAQARESLLKRDASRYRIIHFATHGVLAGPSPMFSSLLLAASQRDGEDGLLEGREVARLSLNAEVVVLAACTTAGTVVPGEGIIGLSWSFLAAGAEKVVMTRWEAESRATSRLMVELHRNLAGGTMSVGAALRAARDRLRRQPRYQHPFYWAPFVIIGS